MLESIKQEDIIQFSPYLSTYVLHEERLPRSIVTNPVIPTYIRSLVTVDASIVILSAMGNVYITPEGSTILESTLSVSVLDRQGDEIALSNFDEVTKELIFCINEAFGIDFEYLALKNALL